MKRVTCCEGKLQIDSGEIDSRAQGIVTGWHALDELLPGGALARGSIHEFLSEERGRFPLFITALVARWGRHSCLPRPNGWGRHSCLPRTFLSEPGPDEQEHLLFPTDGAQRLRRGSSRKTKTDPPDERSRVVAWCDPDKRLYPPALAPLVPLDRLLLLHPKNDADEVWTISECLRCRGVGVTVGSPRRLTSIQARRLQLAAETGGGVGILMRTLDASSSTHAATTRWIVKSFPGERNVQRWSLQLIHGHGGLVGQTVIVEASRERSERETDLVRVSRPVGGGPVSEAPARKFA